MYNADIRQSNEITSFGKLSEYKILLAKCTSGFGSPHSDWSNGLECSDIVDYDVATPLLGSHHDLSLSNLPIFRKSDTNLTNVPNRSATLLLVSISKALSPIDFDEQQAESNSKVPNFKIQSTNMFIKTKNEQIMHLAFLSEEDDMAKMTRKFLTFFAKWRKGLCKKAISQIIRHWQLQASLTTQIN
uniref:Uncharacterized protein n=1 Tax=Romanomermis culicivorax TaxID=13658 RepID=A0A915I4J3_ROMCU